MNPWERQRPAGQSETKKLEPAGETPALPENIRRLVVKTCDWICQTAFHKTKNVPLLFLLPGLTMPPRYVFAVLSHNFVPFREDFSVQ
jgi:hypothetical protein